MTDSNRNLPSEIPLDLQCTKCGGFNPGNNPFDIYVTQTNGELYLNCSSNVTGENIETTINLINFNGQNNSSIHVELCPHTKNGNEKNLDELLKSLCDLDTIVTRSRSIQIRN
jgi:DNA-binding beta-propeller fold protein YncE